MKKRTLQEVADFFECYIGIDGDGEVKLFKEKPIKEVYGTTYGWYSQQDNISNPSRVHSIEIYEEDNLIIFPGDKDTLIIPKNFPTYDMPFKAGDKIVYIGYPQIVGRGDRKEEITKGAEGKILAIDECYLYILWNKSSTGEIIDVGSSIDVRDDLVALAC